jgi:hypothetical protein
MSLPDHLLDEEDAYDSYCETHDRYFHGTCMECFADQHDNYDETDCYPSGPLPRYFVGYDDTLHKHRTS